MLSERPCVLLSWCPGVLVPACVDIVWAGYGTPWPGLDYHKEWGWLAAYKKDARQTRQHTLGHTRALILPVCVFLKGGDASNIEQPFRNDNHTISEARGAGVTNCRTLCSRHMRPGYTVLLSEGEVKKPRTSSFLL